jgi:hypothetical protein
MTQAMRDLTSRLEAKTMHGRSIAVTATIVTMAVISLFVARSRPVVYAFTEYGDPVREPIWSFLNPFRDRAPEVAAEAVLSHFKRGDYAQALSQIEDPAAVKRELSEHEKQYRLRSWKLLNRRDADGTVKLFYRTERGQSKGLESPLWISVQRASTDWKVTRFEAWY